MDPNTTYQEMLMAFSESNWEEANEHANVLLAWLRRGGFGPRVTIATNDGSIRVDLEDNQANRQIADATARLIASKCSQKLNSE